MKRRHLIFLVIVLILAVLFFYRTNPERHAEMFVSMYADRIEKNIYAGEGVPENLGCLDVNEWDGMTEFILSGWGIGSDVRYYGCYYSPGDVPLPFQNASVELTQDGHGYWTWTAGGDNHGSTQKIKDHWYYFEASF